MYSGNEGFVKVVPVGSGARTIGTLVKVESSGQRSLCLDARAEV